MEATNPSPRERRWLAAAGLAGIAIPIFEWCAHLAILLAFTRITDLNLDILGERGSHTELIYNFLGFCLPALLLAVFAIGLEQAISRDWIKTGTCVLLGFLTASSMLLGILPYAPDLPLLSSLRVVTRFLYFWCLPPAAILIGIGSYKRAQYSQFFFSLVAGLLMAVLTWLGFALNLTEQTLLVIDTFWYAATGAWLLHLSQISVEAPQTKLSRAALNVLRCLAAAAVLASIYPVVRVFSAYIPVAQAQVSSRIQVYTLQQGQFLRTYRVYRPAHVQLDAGLVILLHGSGGTGIKTEIDTRFDRQADRLGWVVAYPDGISNLWNAYGCCSDLGVDDVKFLSSMISQLEVAYGLNSDRVYIAGFSLGAMMAYRAACELSAQVVAIAPVAGNMATANGSVQEVHCQPEQVVSILALHGTDDPNVPMMGGQNGQAILAPFSEVIAQWRQIDGCSQPSSVAINGTSTTTVWVCQNGSSVETRIIAGGGHSWPGSTYVLDPNSPDASFNASQVIADFFASQTRLPTP